MTYRILITDDLSPQSLAKLDQADDVEYDVIKGLTPEKFEETIVGYDGLIVRSSVKVTEAVLTAADKLKVVGRAGVGVDNIDIPAASVRGVIVMNTPGANTIATTEHTFGLMLALCRNIPQAHGSMKEGKWNRKAYMGIQLHRKTIGIIGMGRVGTRMALRCQAFGMEVLAYDPYLSDEVAHELKVKPVELPELLAKSDFITLHAAHTAHTDKLINAETIAQMKDGVRIVNAARGKLIDDDALVEGLKSGKIAGAAFDVFTKEPLDPNSPLLTFDNVVVTPHLAASTVEAQQEVGIQIVDQVLDALRGKHYRNALNVPVADANLLHKLQPFLVLAEKVGSLQAQLAEDAIQRIEIEVSGDAVGDHVKPLTVALLKGALEPYLEEGVNYINAPHLAQNRGISVSEGRRLSSRNFSNLIACRALWQNGERTIAATLFHDDEPRLVQLDDYRLDVRPEGVLLSIANRDEPGFIGQVGTLLGEHNINIAAWRYGRTESGKYALSFLRLDTDISEEVIEAVRQIEPVEWVKKVVL